MANRHGLARDIPADVARTVRQRDGFGCVVCGDAFFEYDHFDPPFANATRHDPAGIALLCYKCHAQKERGLLSPNVYQGARRDPAARRRGYSATQPAWGDFVPEIVLGTRTLSGGSSVLRIGGELLLGFEFAPGGGQPPLLYFRCHDRNGQETLRIRGNEIQGNASTFDMEALGSVWTVRSDIGQIDLRVRFDPPTRVTIDRLNFRYGRWSLGLDGSILVLKFDGGLCMAFPEVSKTFTPCLLELECERPHIFSKSVMSLGGVLPCPLGFTPAGKGFLLHFPLWSPFDEQDLARVFAENGRDLLTLFANRELGLKAFPYDTIRPLTAEQCLLQLAVHRQATGNPAVCLNWRVDPFAPYFSCDELWNDIHQGLE